MTAAEYQKLAAAAPRRKYRNTPTVIDGVRFDSAGEADRWGELRLLQAGGAIRDLRRQVAHPLFVNGVLVCTLRADFEYVETASGRVVTEDFKGVRTKDWTIKAKLFRALTGREVLETRRKVARRGGSAVASPAVPAVPAKRSRRPPVRERRREQGD